MLRPEILLALQVRVVPGLHFSQPFRRLRRLRSLRRAHVKLILRSYVIRLGGAFRRDLGRALGCALARRRAETLRYRQQQKGSDCCCYGKSGHSLGLHEWCNVCVLQSGVSI